MLGIPECDHLPNEALDHHRRGSPKRYAIAVDFSDGTFAILAAAARLMRVSQVYLCRCKVLILIDRSLDAELSLRSLRVQNSSNFRF